MTGTNKVSQAVPDNQSIEDDLLPDIIEPSTGAQEKCCRVCDIKADPSIIMFSIPTNHEILVKCLKAFGQHFTDNFLKYPAPHYVCLSHAMEHNWRDL
ncbi:unnamed protein product [Caenorhabditis angaria]|uniref:Uncharacterized protein n=1 Tax=Caenorhabditis angaria TaxID=860376 RepID=A0A9P1NAF2_9PELO|nr:unnamed protein product [Caenorhabditis angaria]